MVRHRRESFWQIIFPMVVVGLVLVGVFALIVLSGTESISGAADASWVLVSLPILLVGLLALALVAGLLFGLGWLLSSVPPYSRIAQDVSARVSEIVQKAMQQVTNVVISALTGFSMARRFMGGNGTDGTGDDSQPDTPES
jgi:hypothetical protein